VHDQPNDLDRRVGQLESSIERLTSENTSLKLELATLISALRERQSQQPLRRVPAARIAVVPDPPIRPSLAPAGVVVLLAVGLLSWQLIVTPHPDPSIAPANRAAIAIARAVDPVAAAAEPKAPLIVEPTVYKGTLSVKADLPGAQVFVNRKIVGTAPVRVRNLRAGSHLVWVEREGYRRWTRVITVPAERVTSVSVDLEPVIEN
jgi:hypothetical protein